MELARPLRFLHWGFWGCVLSFALAMGVEPLFAVSGGSASLPSAVNNILLAAFAGFACVYWVALGVLAHRTGRSRILWIVLGLATLALGFVVSYILMVSRVRRELSGAAARGTPSRSSRGSA
jgi:hypothetical protein